VLVGRGWRRLGQCRCQPVSSVLPVMLTSASTSHCLPALLTSPLPPPKQAALLAQQEEEASGLQAPLHDCLIEVLPCAVKGGQPRYHAAVKAGRKVGALLGPSLPTDQPTYQP
jgi:hypothetical protein